MTPRASVTPLQGSVSLNTELGEFLNETRVCLLEAIDSEGTLTHAARRVPMSYKAAWDALETMSRQAGRPLVERVTGGRNGGGTLLTEHGRCLVALYRAVNKECQVAIGALVQHLDQGGNAISFRYLLHRQARACALEAAQLDTASPRWPDTPRESPW